MKRAELQNIRKTFHTPAGPGFPAESFQALGGVDIVFHPGEIHALLGENGAGKSTLVHILSGLYQPTSGCVRIGGRDFCFTSPSQALSAGVAMVHQQPLLSDELTVLENTLLGVPGFFLSKKKALRTYAELQKLWNISLDPETQARTLTQADRLRAALLAAVYRNPDFLILDEPSSVFSPEERDAFFESLRAAAERGMGIILITHRIGEAVRWSHRISVLRKGELIYSSNPEGGEQPTVELISALLSGEEDLPGTGQAKKNEHSKNDAAQTGIGFSVEGLSLNPRNRQPLREIAFTAKAGSITAIEGLAGSGLDVLEDALTGMLTAEAGVFRVGGREIQAAKANARLLRKEGVAMVPSDRSFRGSHPALPVRDIAAPALPLAGIIDLDAIDSFAGKILDSESIPARSKRAAGSLSGGQLQRIILAREIARKPKVLILSRPEWGLDISSTARLQKTLTEEAREGTTIIVLTDNPEAFDENGFFDARYTLSDGRLS
ncbi:ATP-binding cassette domain-containing protein [Treponema zuelzerae]|uniref:ATP-binding cassette domain-containing protein n=1 Tax=Teretinema zuelzerae TaxID=156 RepID=A0AAE3JJF5_9SPIR|nr:ATP-binding cassette domain-containing protein [Teretinema zuelzerae]MCD1655468.1 ATP-binding cassette domain-containing protein [Teretinema zuelzerae]